MGHILRYITKALCFFIWHNFLPAFAFLYYFYFQLQFMSLPSPPDSTSAPSLLPQKNPSEHKKCTKNQK